MPKNGYSGKRPKHKHIENCQPPSAFVSSQHNLSGHKHERPEYNQGQTPIALCLHMQHSDDYNRHTGKRKSPADDLD
jgi:hypothetical protein